MAPVFVRVDGFKSAFTKFVLVYFGLGKFRASPPSQPLGVVENPEVTDFPAFIDRFPMPFGRAIAPFTPTPLREKTRPNI